MRTMKVIAVSINVGIVALSVSMLVAGLISGAITPIRIAVPLLIYSIINIIAIIGED